MGKAVGHFLSKDSWEIAQLTVGDAAPGLRVLVALSKQAK